MLPGTMFRPAEPDTIGDSLTSCPSVDNFIKLKAYFNGSCSRFNGFPLHLKMWVACQIP